MATTINTGFSTVQAIAELIQGRMEPAASDERAIEIEDIIEEVRNSFSAICWRIYMDSLAGDGERNIIESLLQRKRYEFSSTVDSRLSTDKSQIVLDGIQIINLPRDAGIYQVIAFDKDNKVVGNPLTKTNPGAAYMPTRLDPGQRYYRVHQMMFFPDKLDDCVKGVDVIFFGLLDDADLILVPRDYADMVRDKVWAKLFPSKQIPVDVTNNANPNN